jgi:hypothetical protein
MWFWETIERSLTSLTGGRWSVIVAEPRPTTRPRPREPAGCVIRHDGIGGEASRTELLLGGIRHPRREGGRLIHAQHCAGGVRLSWAQSIR